MILCNFFGLRLYSCENMHNSRTNRSVICRIHRLTLINDDVEDPDEDEEDTADNEDVVHYFHREETPQNPNTNNVHTEDNPEHQISILKLRVLGMSCCTL